MRRINLRCMIPNITDATSLYRAMGPLSELRHEIPNFDLVFEKEHNWAMTKMSDIFFAQRPYNESSFTIIQMAKRMKRPVWVDYDDDLFCVPPSNPSFHVYSKEEVQRRIAACISLADHVTVSTPALKRKLEAGGTILNKNITVVPNALDPDLPKRTANPEKRAKLVFWRGSSTHQKDLYTFGKQLVDISKDHKDYTFFFQGDKPWFLYEQTGKNVRFGENLDPMEYFEMINTIKPSIVIVPLFDDEFNRSKSNIAWLEGIYAGAVVLAPDWEEWQRPGCINYKSPGDFGAKLRDLLSNGYDINGENQKAWNYIQENLTLKNVNKLRKKIVEDLLAEAP